MTTLRSDNGDASPDSRPVRRRFVFRLRSMLILVAISAVLLAWMALSIQRQASYSRLKASEDVITTYLTAQLEEVRGRLSPGAITTWSHGGNSNPRQWSLRTNILAGDGLGIDRPAVLIEVTQELEGRRLGPVLVRDYGGEENGPIIESLAGHLDRLGWPYRVVTPEDDPEVAAVAASEGQFQMVRSLVERTNVLPGPVPDRYAIASTSRTSGAFKDPWLITFGSDPSPPEGGEDDEVWISVSGGGGAPTTITRFGETGGNAFWLSRLTSAFDAEGWPYEVRRAPDTEAGTSGEPETGGPSPPASSSS